MKQYEVVSGCYVPMGSKTRFRPVGQVVTLSDEQAAELADFIKPVDPSGVLQNATPEPEAAEQPHESFGAWSERVDQAEPAVVQDATDEIAEEVISDVSDPAADNE